MLLVAAQPADDGHVTGIGHPENRDRVPAALAGLADAGLAYGLEFLPARAATRDELLAVHRGEYLDALEGFCQVGGGPLDPDTDASVGSWLTALAAAGAGLATIDALRNGQGDAAIILMRPPGHHALPDRAMGFCLLNNVAVTGRALVEAGERVLIVDWDVHHGNGTQAMFWDDRKVLYASIHQAGLWPGTGQVTEWGGPHAPGMTINVPVPPGATGDVLLAAIDQVIAPAVDHFRPTWVLVSAGFDAHRADPLAELALSAGDFADLAKRVQGMAPTSGRLILFLEGGYDLGALRASVGAVGAQLLGQTWRPERATSGGPGHATVARIRRRLMIEQGMSP